MSRQEGLQVPVPGRVPAVEKRCTKRLFLPSKKKAEMNFTQSMGVAECNFQNSDKKYLAYLVHTKQL